jgi:hypothetical protein
MDNRVQQVEVMVVVVMDKQAAAMEMECSKQEEVVKVVADNQMDY